MKKIISKVEITELFDQKDIQWELQDVSVLVGKNGVGKSTILHTIYDLLISDDSDSIIQRAESSKLTMADKSTIEYITDIGIDKTLEKKLIDIKESLERTKLEYSTEYSSDSLSNEISDLIKRIDKNLAATRKNILVTKNRQLAGRRFSFGRFKKRGLFFKENDTNIVLISTSNLNANSINEIKNSSGKRTIILDIEIEREIETFKLLSTNLGGESKDNFEEIKENLRNVSNEMFADSGKEVLVSNELTIKCSETKKTIALETLSSGEKQLLYILLKVANSATKDSVLLMDEPEISLHLNWQSKLITSISKINKRCQLIIVTHSPAIVMDGWRGALVDINSISQKSKSSKASIFDEKR